MYGIRFSSNIRSAHENIFSFKYHNKFGWTRPIFSTLFVVASLYIHQLKHYQTKTSIISCVNSYSRRKQISYQWILSWANNCNSTRTSAIVTKSFSLRFKRSRRLFILPLTGTLQNYHYLQYRFPSISDRPPNKYARNIQICEVYRDYGTETDHRHLAFRCSDHVVHVVPVKPVACNPTQPPHNKYWSPMVNTAKGPGS